MSYDSSRPLLAGGSPSSAISPSEVPQVKGCAHAEPGKGTPTNDGTGVGRTTCTRFAGV